MPLTRISKKEAFGMILGELDKIPNERVPPEHLPELEEVRAELRAQVAGASCTSSSNVDGSAPVGAGIPPGSGLVFTMPISEDEIEAATRKLDAIRQVSKRASEHLITKVLTHVCLAMTDNETQRVSIVREFDMGETTFKTDSGPKTFYGTIDYLLVRVQPGEVWQASPTMALRCATANNIPATAIIIGTEKDGLQDAVPRAAISAASFCNRYDLSTVRGCITSGEQWLFFHYCPDGSRDSLESTIYLAASEISLGSDLQNLALVMGLLKDMVQNPFDPNTKFFDLA